MEKLSWDTNFNGCDIESIINYLTWQDMILEKLPWVVNIDRSLLPPPRLKVLSPIGAHSLHWNFLERQNFQERTKLSREDKTFEGGPIAYPNCLDKVGLIFMIRLVDGGFVYEDKGRPISSQPKHSPFAQITLTKCSKRVGGREKFWTKLFVTFCAPEIPQ